MGFPYAPESVGSISGSISSSPDTGPFATSKKNRSAKTSSSLGWRMESLTRLLSGATSQPLTPDLGVRSLTSYMAGIRANRSVSPASVPEPLTPGTCGLMWPASWPSAGRRTASLRTSAVISASDFERSPETWKVWVTACRQDSLRRLKSARHTAGSGSTFSPDDTKRTAWVWPTPNVPNGGCQPKGGMSPTGLTPDGKKRQVGLHNAVARWTLSEKALTNGLFGHRAPRSGISGLPSSPDGPSWPLRLNPLFVEWLMGFPIGHTDLKPLATRSYQTWPRQHGRGFSAI